MRAIRLGLCLGALLGLLAVGIAGATHHEAGGPPNIQVVTTLVGGKNVFVPSTIVVAAGQPHVLSIFNTTDKPHGFRIPGLGIEAILPSQEEVQVQLPALEGNAIQHIVCHLHPPHRTATLVVLETQTDSD
jgi:hypothetical protein